ncbi:MAG: PEP-CTERM sorting domain-containing protein, partial [Microcoleaceae cyanobacterium]
VVLTQVSGKGGGFETDNHSFLLSDSGFNPETNKSVPEPGMVLGLLALGGMFAAKHKANKV